MARLLTARDASTIMNALYNQATGKTDITNVDLSNFASVGEQVLATGTENVLNALSIVLGRTIAAVRPYDAKLGIISAINTGEYTHRFRKISFYSKDAIEAGFVNTDIKTNMKDGYDNGTNEGQSTASMWKQDIAPVLELNFAGQNVWQEELTIFEKQLSTAFRSPDELATFLNGIMQQKLNSIEKRKEGFRRGTLLQHIAAVYKMGNAKMSGSVVNLTKKFNDEFGTNYTSAELRTTYQDKFLKFFVSEFKLASDYMTEYSQLYHYNPTKNIDGVNYYLERHTSKAFQKSILYGPLFTKAKANVFPDIFNTQYLDIKSNELVSYWQDIKNPESIKITPALPDGNVTSAVSIPYVVGVLFDKDAILTDTQWEDSSVTPLEARKKYRNMFWDFSYNAISDLTENCIIFIMEDEA